MPRRTVAFGVKGEQASDYLVAEGLQWDEIAYPATESTPIGRVITLLINTITTTAS
jgi:hypothetical protein